MELAGTLDLTADHAGNCCAVQTLLAPHNMFFKPASGAQTDAGKEGDVPGA